jgi:hypothetical protein
MSLGHAECERAPVGSCALSPHATQIGHGDLLPANTERIDDSYQVGYLPQRSLFIALPRCNFTVASLTSILTAIRLFIRPAAT